MAAVRSPGERRRAPSQRQRCAPRTLRASSTTAATRSPREQQRPGRWSDVLGFFLFYAKFFTKHLEKIFLFLRKSFYKTFCKSIFVFFTAKVSLNIFLQNFFSKLLLYWMRKFFLRNFINFSQNFLFQTFFHQSFSVLSKHFFEKFSKKYFVRK